MRRNRWIFRAALVALGAGATATAVRAQTDTVARPLYNPADVQFVQGMMHHHAQAIAMSALVPSRSARADIRTAARRIGVSQRDEIALMQRWLERRGQVVPSVDTSPPATDRGAMKGMPMPVVNGGGDHQMRMPGMLTLPQLDQLAAAKGATFDSLFLRFMIGHHEGALTIVAQLFAVPGAAQESEIFQLASDIDSDQRAEIARMRAMQRVVHLTKKRRRS